MRNVAISEPLYDEVARRAAVHGQSLDALVGDVLAAYLDDGPLRLTPEQLAKIDRAEADIDAGNCYTSEQVEAQLDEVREAWIRESAR